MRNRIDKGLDIPLEGGGWVADGENKGAGVSITGTVTHTHTHAHPPTHPQVTIKNPTKIAAETLCVDINVVYLNVGLI
jgi:hypothetical protein